MGSGGGSGGGAGAGAGKWSTMTGVCWMGGGLEGRLHVDALPCLALPTHRLAAQIDFSSSSPSSSPPPPRPLLSRMPPSLRYAVCKFLWAANHRPYALDKMLGLSRDLEARRGGLSGECR